jgi:hypothetical protein
VKSTASRESSSGSTQLETTTNTQQKQADPGGVEQKSATPTAQETKSSQQLASAKKEELVLTSLSTSLNRTLDSVTIGYKAKVSAPKTNFTNEEIFSTCEKGHEQPKTIIDDPDKANKSVLSEYQDMISNISSSPASPIVPDLMRSFFGKLPLKISPNSDQTSNINSEGHDTAGWLNKDFLGSTIHDRFSKTPPFFTTVPPSYFRAVKKSEGLSDEPNGVHIPGSNHVLISSGYTNEADRRRLLVHEQLHYASYLGGGHPTNIRWRDEKGQPITGSKPYAESLHEGIGELMAQKLTRDKGFTTTDASYPKELRVAFLVDKIVDDDAVMRKAFLTGNFTEVRKKVDLKLPDANGKSTFDQLMQEDNPDSVMQMLKPKMDDAGMDYVKWMEDPLFKIATPGHLHP